MNSHLLEGAVRHRRARPFVYDFEHAIYYVALDLGELDDVAAAFRLVGRNRPSDATYDRQRQGANWIRTCIRFIRVSECHLALSEAGLASGISQDLQIALEKERPTV